MAEKKEMVSFTVRVPAELNEKLEADADKLFMGNKNLQVNSIIKEHYESKKVEKAAAHPAV